MDGAAAALAEPAARDAPAIGAIAPLGTLVDLAAFRGAMAIAVAAGSEGAQARMVAACRSLLDEGRAAIRDAFEAAPLAGYAAGHSLAELHDELVRTLHGAALALYPLPHPTSSERLAVVAVGGYGRGSLAPQSDIDLLFLLPYKRTAWAETIVETMLYALWDLGLKVGQATRSIDDCLRLARGDMTIRTSLLEVRLLAGDEGLFGEMRQRLWDELFAKTGAEFVAAKLDERAVRHRQAGDSRYLLEPNIKEGKGALRDLHSLFWIGKYLYHADTARDLVAMGVFSEGEGERFEEAGRFLWTVRFWVHYLSGRANEQLTFDRQVEIADRMGFVTQGGLSGVERFMKAYFEVAKEVGDLTRIFCAALEAQQIATKREGVRRFFAFFGWGGGNDDVQIEHGRLLIDDPAAFQDDPVAILRLFHMAGKSGAAVHPVTLKHVRRNLDLIDDAVRADREANRLFLEMLCDSRDPESALRLMNEAGVLGRFMPEFGEIVCMMQFNMYHHYTVDEHSIRAVGQLAAIERGELAEALPVSTAILKGGVSRRALYVATLIHDIGKGREEDHSTLGARIAGTVCPRLGLSEAETETVVWLVQHHLILSDYAQKRDLADVRTIQDFAATVQSRERLKLLLVLTACDIRAVGPGVWNGWKAQLLRTLYHETEALLSAGHDGAALSRADRIETAKDELRTRLADWNDAEREAFIARHYAPYWLGLDAGTHEVHARMLKGRDPDAFVIDVSGDAARAATRLSIAMGDHPGLFSRFTGAVSLSGAGIVDARTFTTGDGLALATIWLQDRDGEAFDDPGRLERLRTNVSRVMSGELLAREALESRDTIKPRERSFTVTPAVSFDNTASELYTVIEVTGRDRLGLVHDLSRALADQKVSIFSAVIATYGERAVDTFYVKDLFGHKIGDNRRARIEAAMLAVLDVDR